MTLPHSRAILVTRHFPVLYDIHHVNKEAQRNTDHVRNLILRKGMQLEEQLGVASTIPNEGAMLKNLRTIVPKSSLSFDNLLKRCNLVLDIYKLIQGDFFCFTGWRAT